MRANDTVVFSLGYRPPYDWPAILAYLAGRGTPGIEAVTPDAGGRYWRSVLVNGARGYLGIRPRGWMDDAPEAGAHSLEVELSPDLRSVQSQLTARLRRQFDLDAEPDTICVHLGRSARLRPLITRRPGLRLPGATDGFELALRAVLGQQVSVRGATTLAGRLAARIAEPLPDGPTFSSRPRGLTHLPVSADRLAEASPAHVAQIGVPRARAACIVALARATASGELPELLSDTQPDDPVSFIDRFVELPGIGVWTAAYVAMRALHWVDAFPDSDLGLRRAMGRIAARELRAVAEQWRPWRAYAAVHLWASLNDS